MNQPISDNSGAPAVAIIGMSGRFPGAASVEAFWDNLRNGIETISRFTPDELEFSVATEEAKRQGAKFVGARSILSDVDQFDASFFGIYAKEAELMDPQHRLFLECCWEALERAGYDSERYPGLIGVYAGLSMNTYLLHNLVDSREFAANFAGSYQVGAYQVMLGNDKDFMPVRVAYKLNLRGPAISVQCACSTSLVAICQACQSLLSYQCDMALSGGSSISFPQKRDYLYQEEAMVSADGTCRAFDASAHGTVFGHGVGVVLLKRLEDALADGDPILGIVRGFAVNNDGADKVGFAAPSVRGQADVISMAQAMSGVDPETISYIEAHGTATPLGDPIEVAAITQAFRAQTQATNFCALGTAKTYIGHLDVASGVTGLIKTLLQFEHSLIPPLLHFERPNPKIDFANSPLYPVTRLTEWKRGNAPRRAGVSAFGVGGTNAHVVLEEAPEAEPSGPSRPYQLLLLSAKTLTALDQMTANLAEHLQSHPRTNLADAAYTLQVGRRAFEHRRAFVCRDPDEAIAGLNARDPKRVFTLKADSKQAGVIFLFPGQGAQYVEMGKELYATEPVFREELDRCCELLKTPLPVDLRSLLFPEASDRDAARERITQTSITQPALFAIEYALAKLWMSWGVRRVAMVGHSIGEYVAAVLAGVMPLEAGLAILTERARLMQSVPPGGMLSVRLPETEVRPQLSGSLAIAVVNSPKLCVVSGPHGEIEALKSKLAGGGAMCKTLHTSHAFHSSMMEPVVEPFAKCLGQFKFSAAQIPIVSTLTGQWIQPDDWIAPSYWARQLRETVRFADAAGEVLKKEGQILLEVGPGQTLSTLVQQHPARPKEQLVLPSMPPVEDPSEVSTLLSAVGRMWTAGAAIDWAEFHRAERRRRVRLPSYPFERRRYWIEPRPVGPSRNGREMPVGVAHLPSLERTTGNGNGHHPAVPPTNEAGIGAPLSRTPADGLTYSAVEKVIDEQLRLMKAQLHALQGDPS